MGLFSPVFAPSEYHMKISVEWPGNPVKVRNSIETQARYCPVFSDDVCIGWRRHRPIWAICEDDTFGRFRHFWALFKLNCIKRVSWLRIQKGGISPPSRSSPDCDKSQKELVNIFFHSKGCCPFEIRGDQWYFSWKTDDIRDESGINLKELFFSINTVLMVDIYQDDIFLFIINFIDYNIMSCMDSSGG